MSGLSIRVHDEHPFSETQTVTNGLSQANDCSAPLYEVRPISCFIRTESGTVIGGAIGRWWGPCCELQQLWVEDTYRRQGIGIRLVNAFEAHAASYGCSSFYLETFSFQAPAFYEALGYTAAYKHAVYPHGIAKYTMVKHIAPSAISS